MNCITKFSTHTVTIIPICEFPGITDLMCYHTDCKCGTVCGSLVAKPNALAMYEDYAGHVWGTWIQKFRAWELCDSSS